MSKETTAGVNGQQGRLVHHEQLAVFMDYGVGRIHRRFKLCGGLELKVLAGGKLLVRKTLLPIHQDVAVLDEGLPLSLTAIGETPAKMINKPGPITFRANQGCYDTFFHHLMIDAGASGV
jgi:hypothetical protein